MVVQRHAGVLVLMEGCVRSSLCSVVCLLLRPHLLHALNKFDLGSRNGCWLRPYCIDTGLDWICSG